MIDYTDDNVINDNILNSLKIFLNINLDDNSFDPQLMIYIETNILTLIQEGILNKDVASKKNIKWTDLTEDKCILSDLIKWFMFKIKLIIDTPYNSNVIEIYKQYINEAEWRMKNHDEFFVE